MAAGTATRARRVDYPTSDGRPMAETDFHRDLMVRLISILKRWFADKPMVYVSGNLLIYYVPGNKRKHVAPDVFVVFGIRQKNREYYLCWEEGKFPRVVIEITSKSTEDEDNDTNFTIYHDVFRVKEYFQFDPRADYIGTRLRGDRLAKGEFAPMTLGDGRLFSKQLGLYLQVDGMNLQLIDPATGKELLGSDELAEEERTARELAEVKGRQIEATLQQAEAALQQTAATLQQAEAALRQKQDEVQSEKQARLRIEELLRQKEAELEKLRNQLGR